MKNIRKIFPPLLPVLLACFISGCTEPGWYSQAGGISFAFQGEWVLWDAWLFDARRAIVVGYQGAILQTTDGGITWNSQPSGASKSLLGVYFSDSLHGWVVGVGGTILHTIDGGSTWTRQASELTANLAGVFSIDTSTAWAVSEVDESGIIYHTTDGGATWTRQRTNVRTYFFDIFFTDTDTGTAVGGWSNHYRGGPYFSGYILRTVNGGDTWQLQFHDTTMIGFQAVAFSDAFTGIVVGARGTILRTIDGGISWTRQISGTTVDLRDVCFIGVDTGYAVGGESFPPYQGGTVLRTTDGGLTWTTQEIPVKNSLSSVYFTDTKSGLVTGIGTILRTNSGGEPVPGKKRKWFRGN